MLSRLLLFFLAFSFAQCRLFNNPVFRGNEVTRPSIIYINNLYYMVTNNLSADNPERLYFLIHASDNLQDWVRIGYVFDEENFPPYATNSTYLYSPTLHYDEAEKYFYVFFFDSSLRLGAAKSNAVTGPYQPLTKPVELNPTARKDYAAIMYEDNKTYLLYPGYFGITAKRINLSNLTTTQDEAILLVQPTEEWELNDFFGFSYIYRNPYHYIVYTNGAGCAGGLQDKSAVGVARSKTILGRYEKQNWTLLNTTFTGIWGTSHATIVDDRISGYDAVVYSGVDIDSDSCINQQIIVNTVFWTGDSWPFVTKT